MRRYDKTTFWENANRTKALNVFRSNVVDYFNLDASGEKREHARSHETRSTLNRQANNVKRIVSSADISLNIAYQPAFQNHILKNINIIDNLFVLDRNALPHVVDILDRAIGMYETDRLSSIWRTFNPLFWLGLLIDRIMTITVKIFQPEYDSEKIEASKSGRIIKGVIQLVFFAAAFLAILDYIGWLDSLKMG
ncbi:MAG TPA: hypothetical protein PK745_13220 [bacterium]|nr:hypothetical protein [bacterium]